MSIDSFCNLNKNIITKVEKKNQKVDHPECRYLGMSILPGQVEYELSDLQKDLLKLATKSLNI
jgi:hypothetical protein